MKRTQRFGLVVSLGLIVLGMVVFATSPAGAATAAGPYYASPSWDQTLPSDTRFIVLSNMGNNAVLDRETGLVWERSPLAPCLSAFCAVPDSGTRMWSQAQLRCNSLTTGGRLGWRLPTLQELASLVDPAQSSPPLPPGYPFSNVQPSFYWSATTATGTGLVWVVAFIGNGVVAEANITAFVWCVRGGQGADIQ